MDEGAGRKVRVFVFATNGVCDTTKNFFTTPHPKPLSAASHNQTPTKHIQRETEMTKQSSIAAAFVLFAPIAVAILSQAAQIVA